MYEGGISWSAGWSDDRPVFHFPDPNGGGGLYLSIEDAVRRILSGDPVVVLLSEKGREAMRESVRSRLMDGQSVDGFRLIRKEGKA